uniref:Pseudouridine synthase RsuA/RluA-like domain-containing protein n=1 Tax=Arion vulgaris TaxID=1028688 RepID=A0A0B6ZDU6_9EUPU
MDADNLVAVNKPYGLSVFGSSTESSEKSGDSKNKNNIKTLSNILPSLNNKLNCPALSVGLSLKSFYSGIVLLCKHKESAKKLTSFIAECQTQKIQYITYLAITVGMPQCSYEVDLTTNIKRERLHNREMSTVTDIYCHSACKEGKMIKILFNVKPLVVNRSAGAALVQVTINKDKWGAVEVLMSHYLSPVLGDHIYSSRTYMVAEVPFAASAHAAPPAKQKLPSSITELLNSNTDSNDQAEPLFVHRHKLVLNKFPKRSSPPVIITAPPQKEFLTTLQCLGLYKEDMFS